MALPNNSVMGNQQVIQDDVAALKTWIAGTFAVQLVATLVTELGFTQEQADKIAITVQGKLKPVVSPKF